jgi:drug/metabolite transporter (DMT)-like permease
MDKQALVELHGAVLLFGLSGLFGKLLLLSPYGIVFGRTFFATLALGGYLMLSANPPRWPAAKDLAVISLSGLILAAHWLSFFYSIQLATVAVGLLTFAVFPVFVTFLEPLFFQEPLQRCQIFTALAVVAGLLLVVPSYHLENQVTQGALWGVFSGLTFAILALFNRRYVRTYSALLLACCQNGITAIILMPAVLALEWTLTLRALGLLAVLGIFCTAVAHGLFIKSLRRVKAQLASVTAALEPVYGIMFAFVILGEIPTVRMLIGGAIIIGATVWATLKRQAAVETQLSPAAFLTKQGRES